MPLNWSLRGKMDGMEGVTIILLLTHLKTSRYVTKHGSFVTQLSLAFSNLVDLKPA